MKSQKIVPNLWFDRQAQEAVDFYTALFPKSEIGKITHYGKEGFEIHGMPEGSVLTVDFELEGCRFLALNGGPAFAFNPSVSFFVVCETAEEVEALWRQLVAWGQELMPLDQYPWSQRYGWLIDRFGLSWQISLDKKEGVGQKITPLLFFTGSQRGRAREAHDFYPEVFPHSSSDGMALYEPGEPGPEGMVKHAQFRLGGQTFMVMDSGVDNDFPFTEAVSMIVHCQSQEEVDYYWEKLQSGGGQEQQCGWLKDRFGVSWQIVPEHLDALLNKSDKECSERVMKAMLQMTKLDIAALQRAAL